MINIQASVFITWENNYPWFFNSTGTVPEEVENTASNLFLKSYKIENTFNKEVTLHNKERMSGHQDV